ncbi:MAG TPA: hypothetical protein PLQ11_09075 [Beijerinckiaceae bacterium]|nr:hypothetical protein [Beijerinckiaceae bacterium]
MGPFPRAILIACLSILRWMLLVTAGLVVILLVVQQLRGDAEAAPGALAIFAVITAGIGWLCGRAAVWFERQG